MKAQILYKFLNTDSSACNGGYGTWYLPHGNRPGKWMPEIKGELMPFHNGYHLCRKDDLLKWLAPTLYVAEYRGEIVEADDNVVVRQARLLRRVDGYNDRNLRLFACDCAERVLPLFEKERPDDKRPRQAIEVARRFANGKATKDELAAAGIAVGVTAKVVAWAADWATAWAADWAADEVAERKWQLNRFMVYLRQR